MSYITGRVDYNKAKIAAYVVVAGFLALMFVFGVRSATGPELHDGDRTESLTCPVCQGSGEGKQADTRCQACLGNKKLKAVIPGPNHPRDLRGTVRSLAVFKDQAEAEETAANDAVNRKPSLTPVKGAVPQASLIFTDPQGGKTEFTSKATGTFSGIIAPGRYSLEVKAAGFTTKTQDVTVAARQNPIWPEAGGLDPSSPDTLQLDVLLLPGP